MSSVNSAAAPSQRAHEVSGRLCISHSHKPHMDICFCTSTKDRVNGELPFRCCMLPSGISWRQNGDFWHPGKQCLQCWSVCASHTHAAPMPSPACWDVCLSPRHVCSADGIFSMLLYVEIPHFLCGLKTQSYSTQTHTCIHTLDKIF